MPSKSQHFSAIGQVYHNFKVLKTLAIDELQCQFIELVHLPTGANVMHIENDDPENLFCLSFQTLPDSSNGVAHILEHTVLCGSKRFPVKDPFFGMQRRSLNTFMNALTGSDFTCYPASSQVPKDFYNLLDVYLDAVFHPNLNELSFLQEGHRLEFAIPNDPKSPLEYKGIVFNEMKGAMSSASARIAEIMNSSLFPDLTYGVNSGGDPKHIPELTYEGLQEFHQLYYHPSRCLFFFYGNMPLEAHLDFINEKVLKDTKKVPQLPPIPLQARFTEPKTITASYPISHEEDPKGKTLIAFGWLTSHILEQQVQLALSILEIILMDTDASPLKMAFLKSGLCTQASCYLDGEISETPFVILLKGCNPGDEIALENLMRTTLKDIVRKGIPFELIENAMHQLEFYRSEITGDHAPFGLSLFMRSGLLKQHGGIPERGLKIHSLFDEIHRLHLETPTYFPDLITKYLLNNPHFVRVVMTPDKELGAHELAREKAILSKIQESLTAEEADLIVKKAEELASLQKAQDEDDLDILPKVSIEDVPVAARVYPLSQEMIEGIKVFHHSCFTNKIIYADLVFELPDLPQEDLPYVRLLTTLLPQMGCNGRSYIENLDFIQAHTGGVAASLTLNLQAKDHHRFYPSLYIRGKALHRKVSKLFSLIYELSSFVNFNDRPRLKEVILKQYTGLQSTLNQNALKYAINLSAAGLDIPSKIANLWYGLEYFWLIKELALNFDQHADQLIAKLQELQKAVLCLENPHLVITCDATAYDEIKGHRLYELKKLEGKPYSKWQGNYPLVAGESHARIIASPIAFIGKVFKTVSYTHPDAPALNIAAFLFDNLTLHTLLREQGGAYGGGAVNNAMAANFYFYSYRDPNISASINAFDIAIKDLLEGHFDNQDLEEAKLEMMQSLDAPVAPGSRGDLAYGWLCEGKTLEVRQAFRDKLLSLTCEDIISAVQRHIIPNIPSAATVIFAGKELIEKENAKLLAQGKTAFPIQSI